MSSTLLRLKRTVSSWEWLNCSLIQDWNRQRSLSRSYVPRSRCPCSPAARAASRLSSTKDMSRVFSFPNKSQQSVSVLHCGSNRRVISGISQSSPDNGSANERVSVSIVPILWLVSRESHGCQPSCTSPNKLCNLHALFRPHSVRMNQHLMSIFSQHTDRHLNDDQVALDGHPTTRAVWTRMPLTTDPVPQVCELQQEASKSDEMRVSTVESISAQCGNRSHLPMEANFPYF